MIIDSRTLRIIEDIYCDECDNYTIFKHNESFDNIHLYYCLFPTTNIPLMPVCGATKDLEYCLDNTRERRISVRDSLIDALKKELSIRCLIEGYKSNTFPPTKVGGF